MLIPIVLNTLASLFDGSQMAEQNPIRKILNYFTRKGNNDRGPKPAIKIRKVYAGFVLNLYKKSNIADFEYCISFQTKKYFLLFLS